jgi:hypothetical protein
LQPSAYYAKQTHIPSILLTRTVLMELNVMQMKDGTIVLPLLYSYNVELVVSLVMKLVHVINVMTVHI